jgi:hypothetical protein
MKANGYYQPESCQKGRIYFVYDENNSTGNMYKKVEFLDYRPHPGELVIKEDGVTKVIHRRLLYSRNNGSY